LSYRSLARLAALAFDLKCVFGGQPHSKLGYHISSAKKKRVFLLARVAAFGTNLIRGCSEIKLQASKLLGLGEAALICDLAVGSRIQK
jgi:hypothetical protein